MFLLVACRELTGGVVGWRVRVLRGRILLFVCFRLWLNAGVFGYGESCDGGFVSSDLAVISWAMSVVCGVK